MAKESFPHNIEHHPESMVLSVGWMKPPLMWDRFLGVHGVLHMKKTMREDDIHNPYISHIPSYSIIFHHIPSYLSNDDLSSGEWRERFGATQKRVSHSQTPVETIISTTPKGVFFMNNQHV